MTFSLAEFLRNNLVEGYSNGSFTEQQVNIFAFNYLSRGQITQEDFNYILEQIELIKNPKIEEYESTE